MNLYVYDYEVLSNCFIAVFFNPSSEERKIFVIHFLKNEYKEFMLFLRECSKNKTWFVGFNNNAFDQQLNEYFMRKDMSSWNIEKIVTQIASWSNEIIQKANNKEFLTFPEFKFSHNSIDLFKLNHFDSNAKHASLKWCEYSLDWYNILEMPIHHSTSIKTQEQIDTIIEYCINDVRATYEIYKSCKDQIKLRYNLSKEYSLNLMSASEPRIAKEIFLTFLSEKLQMDKKELKSLRTYRNEIIVSELIPSYIHFKTPEFISVYNYFKDSIITDTKSGINYKLNINDHIFTFAQGGIHSEIQKSSIVESNSNYIIIDSDVASMYPNIIINNNLAPAHLPTKQFNELYKSLYERRKELPKSNPNNYVLKIILNSIYGLTNDKNSFVYDPKTTMSTCIIGQLSISMFIEMVYLNIPYCKFIQANTDGLTTRIPIEYKEKYFELAKQWESITNLQFEHAFYSKCITADVNNYIYVYDNGKIKRKGRFEFLNLPLYKNKSFIIIPKAINAYFIDGIEPHEFLKNNRNIFDYCGGIRLNEPWHLEEIILEHNVPIGLNKSIDEKKEYLLKSGWLESKDNYFYKEEWLKNKNFNISKGCIDLEKAYKLSAPKESTLKRNKLHKVARYFISNEGLKLVKVHPDGREIQIESGKWLTTNLNLYEEKEFEKYNINEEYYLNKIYDEINKILPQVTKLNQQLSLFNDDL